MPIVGPYHLGQDWASVQSGLTEADPFAYTAIGTLAFEDERLYDGESVSWLGTSWSTLLAVTGGKIYKLGLDTLADGKDLSSLYEQARTDLAGRFGSPDESKENGAHLIWDQPWGNIVLSYLTIGTSEGINLWYTWSEPFRSMPQNEVFWKALRLRLGIPSLSRRFRQDWLVNWSDEQKSVWCRLRAIEWAEWPLFITQPVVPVCLAFMPWWLPLVGVLALSWLWALVRSHFISVTALRFGVYFVLLKWPVSIGMAIYLAVSGRYWTAALAGLWPAVAVVLLMITPPSQLGRIEAAIVARLIEPTLKAAKPTEAP